MFVIVDMEWVTNRACHYAPTQIAAVRVDENWNTTSEFSSFIRPRDSSFYDWRHVAYNGGKAPDFLDAKNAYLVLTDFLNWLHEDDVLIWWHTESQNLYEKLLGFILKADSAHKSIAIWKHIGAFLSGKTITKGSPYKLAAACNVDVSAYTQHCSKDDVKVLQKLLSTLQYPQEQLLDPPPKIEKKEPSSLLYYYLPFQYDAATNTIHKLGCEQIAGKETHGYPHLKTALRKGHKPCSCCTTEYRQALRERNADTIRRTQYTYIYTPDSPVFHKHTCGMVLYAKSILGTRKYNTVIDTGRMPCQRCCPTANDAARPLPVRQKRISYKEPAPVIMMPKGAEKALKRQQIAIAERNQKLNQEGLTEAERNDIFTLTQPRFAFWAAQGYQSFHTHSCPQLRNLSNLRGFSTFKDATQAGFTPCRKCHPTAKQDIIVSIPFTNRVRMNETVADLEELCIVYGYPCSQEGDRFYLETAVGKWKVYTNTSPIKLGHINLVQTPNEIQYHQQPRLFLSFTDVFDYIKRHDEVLLKKSEEGEIFLKLFAQG